MLKHYFLYACSHSPVSDTHVHTTERCNLALRASLRRETSMAMGASVSYAILTIPRHVLAYRRT